MSIASATSAGSPRISVMPAACMATSVPVDIAMPTSAAASAGASLMPSPTMATRSPPAFSSATIAALSSGSTSWRTSAMPSCSAARRALPPVVAGDENGLHAERLQPLHRRGGAGLEGVAEGQQAEQLRLAGHVGEPGDGSALALQGRCAFGQGARVDLQLGHEATAAQAQLAAADPGRHASPGHRANLLGFGHIDGVALGSVQDGLCQRMLAAPPGWRHCRPAATDRRPEPPARRRVRGGLR